MNPSTNKAVVFHNATISWGESFQKDFSYSEGSESARPLEKRKSLFARVSSIDTLESFNYKKKSNS